MPGSSHSSLRSTHLAMMVLALLLSSAAAQEEQRPTTPEFRPVRLLQQLPAITNVPVLAVDEVDDQVEDAELVLGVVVNGTARAYPINMLTGPQREIINDQLGGTAIAATW